MECIPLLLLNIVVDLAEELVSVQNMMVFQGKFLYLFYFRVTHTFISLGQGCGHNLIAISGLASAIGIKAVLESGKASGKVILFGTPAEGNIKKKDMQA